MTFNLKQKKEAKKYNCKKTNFGQSQDLMLTSKSFQNVAKYQINGTQWACS